jgi:hypothetical protein
MQDKINALIATINDIPLSLGNRDRLMRELSLLVEAMNETQKEDPDG